MTKRRIASVVVSLFLASTATIAVSAPAEAATVPNRFYCHPNPAIFWCYQVNGTHVSGLPDVCHTKLSGMPNTPPPNKYVIHEHDCSSWAERIA